MGNICIDVVKISNKFENCNNDLKKKYLGNNVRDIVKIMETVSGYCGLFGTGYPFYAMEGRNWNVDLPIIEEQIRYNNELLMEVDNKNIWQCQRCLIINGFMMPDLKQICKPCPMVKSTLKPRKVINRLPDIDLWMVCEDDKVELAKKELKDKFDDFGMYTSDVNPIKTIKDVNKIVTDLENGILPNLYLPLDVHIIEYSKLYQLVGIVPFVLFDSKDKNVSPYLPIHPHSLRKVWQYDDTAYNFILDFLYSFTILDMDVKLINKIQNVRETIKKIFTEEEIYSLFHAVASDVVERRFQNVTLQERFKRRIRKWDK